MSVWSACFPVSTAPGRRVLTEGWDEAAAAVVVTDPPYAPARPGARIDWGATVDDPALGDVSGAVSPRLRASYSAGDAEM